MSDRSGGFLEAIPLILAVAAMVIGLPLFVAGFFVSNGGIIIAIGGLGFLAGVLLTFLNWPRRR